MEKDPARYGADLEHWKRRRTIFWRRSSCCMLSGGEAGIEEERMGGETGDRGAADVSGQRPVGVPGQRTHEHRHAAEVDLEIPADAPEITPTAKRHTTHKINYSLANGFADRLLILPNGSALYFLTYNQEPSDFQGWDLGAKVRKLVTTNDVRAQQELRPTGRTIQNIGAWADENLTVKWLETIQFRLATRGAKLIWTFSTTEGITATIKKFLGTARTIATKPAQLLADRINLPGLPKGEMPFKQEPETPNAGAIYFFTEWNPFSGFDEPGGVREICRGKASPYIMMNAYGYAEDVGMRACSNFGEWNVIRPELLPAEGTNYLVTDPHGAWNWAMFWVRVAPGNPSSLYIYRDWPDYRRYGEWAVISDRPNRFDGDKGPAQKRSVGYGPTEYKALILREEVISLAANGKEERDPYRLRLWREARGMGQEGGQDNVGAQPELRPTGETVCEVIRERFIDPRAGRSQHATEKGGVCLIDKLNVPDRDLKTGALLAPGMRFTPAPGLHISEGMNLIQSALYWDRSQPLMPILNYPKLFVSGECRQVIWALANYTGEDGEEGACKAWIDCLRYVLTAGIRHIAPGRVRTSGGGSY